MHRSLLTENKKPTAPICVRLGWVFVGGGSLAVTYFHT